MTVDCANGWLSLIVEDDGPGIPSGDRDSALSPFVRLDPSRNLDDGQGGVGLGLAIARDVANSYGGDIFLGESPKMGGLRVELALPVSD